MTDDPAQIPLPAWPGGADVAVTLSFDVDAEAGMLTEGEPAARQLSSLSEARYGILRGLPRIRALLQREQIPATFYVPGDTAERHTAALTGLMPDGHEIAHHGHLHLRSDGLPAAAQRRELEQGLAALRDRLGAPVTGYRSPSWELTPETLALLGELGFGYDSSCMGDDRPYYEVHGEHRILELPVHWSLDDWPHFAWHPGGNEALAAPSAVLEIWLAEFESALAEHRHITFTMHPEVIGRGHRLAALAALITAMRERAAIWFARHDQVAELVGHRE
ncbi:MAG TPA: polysaccharide deacetylase [Streptosporangiaceae bacterium]|jgi:peptidoglycan/xylan/chitin deacetylase (PgdA/CDA1 family)